MRRILIFCCMALAMSLAGCGANGRFFTLTTTPLSTNFNRTPVGEKDGRSDVRDFDYSYVRVRWNANGIAEIAKENGIDEVFYADLERFSVMGIWTQEWVHIYGR